MSAIASLVGLLSLVYRANERAMSYGHALRAPYVAA